jgi:Tfp pilus assembly protein PilF
MRLGFGRAGVGLLPILAVLAITLVVYWPVGGFPFITLDDEDYVTGNPNVLGGVSVAGVVWAFTTNHAANWHPLTWLSHQLDVEMFGPDAGWHHRVNLLLHCLAAALLYRVFLAWLGAPWESAFAAALFAVHPLHVESVAWISERKDVLSALFWIATLAAYTGYVRKGGGLRYAAVLLCFLLGLLSKPMVVTLPLVLLLLDWWPFGRWAPGRAPASGAVGGGADRRGFLPCLREKIPLLLLSALSSAITLLAQRQGDAVASLHIYPLGTRIANAAVSFATYLRKAFWPSGLAVYYPHPVDTGSSVPALQVAAAVAALAGITALAVRWSRGRPWFGVGWFWYLGTLVPVIGIVQVGGQAMADRYTYIPLIGIGLLAACAIREARTVLPGARKILPAAMVLTVAGLAAAAHRQVGHWRDSTTLFSHALEVTGRNPKAWFNLGDALLHEGRTVEAIRALEEGLRLDPEETGGRINYGMALGRLGYHPAAAEQFRKVLRIRPENPEALVNLGVALEQMGRDGEAIALLRRAVEVRPDFVDARTNLASVLWKTGRTDEARAHVEEALRRNPQDPHAAGLRDEMGLAAGTRVPGAGPPGRGGLP